MQLHERLEGKSGKEKEAGKGPKDWKNLMESVVRWEELQEGETVNETQEDAPNQDWTEIGFQEAGDVLEHVLSEVMAFLELSGTVQDNNYHHLENNSNTIIIEPAEVFNHQETEPVTETVPTIIRRRLQSVTVPPDRSGELEELKTEIERIEVELQGLKKADNLVIKGKVGTVPPNNHHGLKMSTRNRHGESMKVSEIRKGVTRLGENGVIWKAKIDMQRMFREKKLLWGAVPPTTSATPAANDLQEKMLLGEAVPPPTTDKPTENDITEKR